MKFIRAVLCVLCLLLVACPWATAATYVVTNSGDAATGGTLRWAITNANWNPGGDYISFAFTSATTISPTGDLPDVTGTGTVFSATNTGSSAVQLDGFGTRTNGIDINAITCAVRGLVITGFKTAGIMIRQNSNTVQGCYVFTNGTSGIRVDSAWNTIGGTNAAQRNVISSNTNGIYLVGPASNNTIIGNFIGTDPTGSRAMSSQQTGISITRSPGNTIGGTNAGARNIISGNANGIQLMYTNSLNNLIQNNYIGTDTNGTVAISNGVRGIWIDGAVGTRIGGTSTNQRNIIAACPRGINIQDSQATSNTIQGNYFGLSAAGSAMSNSLYGIYVVGSPSNVIGGAVSGAGNVIGCSEYGIYLQNTNTCGTVIQGNYIGTDPLGTSVRPNDVGIYMEGARQTQIGGTNAAARNLVSGNSENGIQTGTDGDTCVIEGNYIGTDATGMAILSNRIAGVALSMSYGRIGGTNVSQRNVISGNGSGMSLGATVHHVQIFGNYIGVDATGTNALGNGNGISGGGYQNEIGREGAGGGNVISGNSGYGIQLSSGTSSNYTIANNHIGVDRTGARALGNNVGIYLIYGGPTNTIGGTNAAQRNIIAGNTGDGINLRTATGLVVRANYIGVGTNLAVLPNGGDGIDMQGCGDFDIGGPAVSGRNVIGGNREYGLYAALCATGTVRNNYMGVTPLGTASNGMSGVYLATGRGINLSSNVISANGDRGVRMQTCNSCTLGGNFIGTDPSGTADWGNVGAGVYLQGPAYANVIGGTDGASGNVISGNGSEGVRLNASSVSNTTIAGNMIGTDVTGTQPLGNQGGGISADGSFAIIGGTNAGARNVISGNGSSGVALTFSGSYSNQVLGNIIGADVTGTNPIPNATQGVSMGVGVSNNIVGGMNTNSANRIAFNRGNGITVYADAGNRILGNSIWRNEGLGIDLGSDGVTANDNQDPDLGANRLQNYPVLLVATNSGTDVTVVGTLNSLPSTAFTIELFGSRDPDLSGYGEGQVFLGRTNVTTPAGGVVGFTGVVSVVSRVPNFITATATAITNMDTSEFSQRVFLDTDGDGMGDGYEAEYLGGYTNGNPAADGDGDGINNLDEFVCETDPKVFDSALKMTRLWRDSGDWSFTIAASDCRTYVVDYSWDLAAPEFGRWYSYTPVMTRTNGAVTFHDGRGLTTTAMAYRVWAIIP